MRALDAAAAPFDAAIGAAERACRPAIWMRPSKPCSAAISASAAFDGFGERGRRLHDDARLADSLVQRDVQRLRDLGFRRVVERGACEFLRRGKREACGLGAQAFDLAIHRLDRGEHGGCDLSDGGGDGLGGEDVGLLATFLARIAS